MMGRLFAIIICFCLFLLFVSLCAGTLLSFLFLRKRVRLGGKIGYSLLLGFVTFIFLLLATGYLMYREEKISLDYWRHRGTYDHLKLSYESYRIPLGYPYELYMGKGWPSADIRGWWHAFSDDEEEKRRIIVLNVLSIHKHNSLVLGGSSTATYGTKVDSWFIFDCNDGSKILYENKTEFLDAIKGAGASVNLRLTPVKQAWKEFWADSSNWKGKERMPVRIGVGIESDWSTEPPSKEKVEATNAVRRKLGIREIKERWHFYGRQFGGESWKEGSKLCKGIQYYEKYETILGEADWYYSGRRFKHPNPDAGLIDEKLSLCYDYETKRFAFAVTTDNQKFKDWEYAFWETTPTDCRAGFMGRTNEETLIVVDKILREWGLERL